MIKAVMELVTVIIPTFNSEKVISRSIDSVFTQKYPRIEIIIVDDGSTDNSVAVARQKLQGFANFQILELGKNQGASAARNAGLRAATGTWVQFLDSDDLLMPGKLETQMAVCNTVPADVAAVYSPWNHGHLSDDGQIEWLAKLRTPDIEGKAPIMCLVAGPRPLLAGNLTRKTVLDAVGGFDEALRFWECEELCVRVAEKGRFVSVPTNEATYLWTLRRGDLYIGGQEARYQSKDVCFGWIKLAVKAAHGRLLDELLSKEDKYTLLHECTAWARLLYSQHKADFGAYLSLAQKLDPNVGPAYPSYIAALSRLIGYEKAEGVARLTRQPKVWLRRILYFLKLKRPNTMIELR
jgi:glycosyltransferase involved in cell wall biosynthesis